MYYLIYNYREVSLPAAVFRVLSTTCLSNITPDKKLPGLNSVGLDIMGQLLIRYPTFVRYCERLVEASWNVMAHAQARFHLSVKWVSPFKSAGASIQSTTGSQGVCSSNAGYNMFEGSVKGPGYPLLLPVSPSLPLPCVTVCHHISTGV